MQTREQGPPRTRDPEATRAAILEAAFAEIHRSGFRAASLEDILSEAGVTKGALYHHFANKQALGLAVLDELIRDIVVSRFLAPLAATDDPLTAVQQILEHECSEATLEMVSDGCPLNNLAQEMSSVDEEFQARLADIFREWRHGIARAIAHGQEVGTVRGDISPDEAATFLVASFEGTIGLAKTVRDLSVLGSCRSSISHYLETLRPPGG